VAELELFPRLADRNFPALAKRLTRTTRERQNAAHLRMSWPPPPSPAPGPDDDSQARPADEQHVGAKRRAAEASAAGRGGVAILGAKLYFVLIGLVQQVALKAVLGLAGYGAYSTAQAVASITYNPVVQASIQGVSRTLAAAGAAERPALLRQMLRWHAAVALALGTMFFILAGPTATLLGARHLVGSIRVLSVVVVVYGLYAPLIGALNGQKRFLSQALLDVAAATLRTLGLLLGAWLFIRSHGRSIGAVEAANLGFVLASVLILLTAASIAGLGHAGRSQFTGAKYAAFTLPVLGGQFLLNVLFQADSLLLRRFLGEAALGQGLGPEAADPLVGAYRAAQMFCFLPYQLLMSVTFILFPLLAEAKARGTDDEVKRLVSGGLRLGTIATGAMLTALLAVPHGLIALVYGVDAAALGATAMRPLAVGLGGFALVGLITSALNSLGAPGASLRVTALATLLVTGFCFAAGFHGELGEALLVRTAVATSAALLIACAISQGVLRQHVGASLDLKGLGRTALATFGASFGVARAVDWLGWSSHGSTLLAAALAVFVYFALLVLGRELDRRDLVQLGALLGRPSAK
jgi:stage V sporulation protein B